MKHIFVHLISYIICVSLLCNCTTNSISSYLLNLNEQHIMSEYNSLKNTTQHLHSQINLLKREHTISKTISELHSAFPNISTIPVQLSTLSNNHNNNNLKVISSFSSVTNRNKCMYSGILEITIDNYKSIYTVIDTNGNKVLNVDILEIPTLFFICIDTTKNNIHLLTQHGELLSTTVLFNNTSTTASSIAVVDFSLLTDDTTISILTASHDIITVKLAITITYNNTNKSVNGLISVANTAQTTIPLTHSLLHDSAIIHFNKNRFRGGKYISVAYSSGEIFVYSSTLSLITAIHLHKTITHVKVIQGILFVCEGNKIHTFNSLGGNSILVQCDTFYNIVDITYDFINGLVFIIDSMKHLVILSTKLTITKPQDNECRVIYRFTLPDFVEVNERTSLYLQRGTLFILTSNYIGVINIDQAKESKRKLAIEHYYLVERSGTTMNTLMYGYRTEGNDNVLIVSGGMEVFRYEKEEKRRRANNEDDEVEEQRLKRRKIKKGVECNGNKICMVFFNTSSKNNKVNFSLFGGGIGGLFLMSYFFYKKQKEKKGNGSSKEDDKHKEEKLLQVLKSLQEEESKFKRRTNEYHNNTNNNNNSKEDNKGSEGRYKEHEEEEYEYEEEEDEGEGEEMQEQYNTNINNNMHNGGRYNNTYSDEDEEIENDD